MLIGSATTVLVATLLLIHALDNPYRPGVGSIRPVAMERSLRLIGEARAALGETARAPVRRERERHVTDRVEVVATVLLAVAAVATAWSSYQATRWNGEQAKAASLTNALRIDAARAQGLAEAQTADRRGDVHPVGGRLRARRDASWRTSTSTASARSSSRRWTPGSRRRPLKNPDAPLTPFAMPQYRLAADREAERLDAEARGLRGDGADRHPARVQLRPRRRAVRGRALLRRHEHQAPSRSPAAGHGRARLRPLPRHGDLDRHLAGEHRGMDRSAQRAKRAAPCSPARAVRLRPPRLAA